MYIDIDGYSSVSKKIVIDWYETKSGKDVSRTISMMAGITFVPCIVIAYWLGEHLNWSDPQCEKSIKTLVDFYGYSTIDNKPKGSPV